VPESIVATPCDPCDCTSNATADPIAALVVTVPVTVDAESPVTLSDKAKLFAISFAAKLAVTLRASLIVTVQADVPVHAPLQPVNVESFAAVAVSVTLVPAL
jgi:hypothetical protein